MAGTCGARHRLPATEGSVCWSRHGIGRLRAPQTDAAGCACPACRFFGRRTRHPPAWRLRACAFLRMTSSATPSFLPADTCARRGRDAAGFACPAYRFFGRRSRHPPTWQLRACAFLRMTASATPPSCLRTPARAADGTPRGSACPACRFFGRRSRHPPTWRLRACAFLRMTASATPSFLPADACARRGRDAAGFRVPSLQILRSAQPASTHMAAQCVRLPQNDSVRHTLIPACGRLRAPRTDAEGFARPACRFFGRRTRHPPAWRLRACAFLRMAASATPSFLPAEAYAPRAQPADSSVGAPGIRPHDGSVRAPSSE
jgi:hypothetical protein